MGDGGEGIKMKGGGGKDLTWKKTDRKYIISKIIKM